MNVGKKHVDVTIKEKMTEKRVYFYFFKQPEKN